MTSWSDEYRNLKALEDLTAEAIGRCKKALILNPTESDAADLNSMVIELETKATLARDRINAILNSRQAIKPPSSEQVDRVKKLAAQVEAQTNATLTASATLEFGGKVIDLVNELAS